MTDNKSESSRTSGGVRPGRCRYKFHNRLSGRRKFRNLERKLESNEYWASFFYRKSHRQILCDILGLRNGCATEQERRRSMVVNLLWDVDLVLRLQSSRWLQFSNSDDQPATCNWGSYHFDNLFHFDIFVFVGSLYSDGKRRPNYVLSLCILIPYIHTRSRLGVGVNCCASIIRSL